MLGEVSHNLAFEILEMLISILSTPDFHLSDTSVSEVTLAKTG